MNSYPIFQICLFFFHFSLVLFLVEKLHMHISIYSNVLPTDMLYRFISIFHFIGLPNPSLVTLCQHFTHSHVYIQRQFSNRTIFSLLGSLSALPEPLQPPSSCIVIYPLLNQILSECNTSLCPHLSQKALKQLFAYQSPINVDLNLIPFSIRSQV